MASATVDAVTSSQTADADTTHTVSIPAGSPGDRLYIGLMTDRSPQPMLEPSGWDTYFSQAISGASVVIFAKDDEGETSVSVSSGATACESAHIAFRVSGDADPAVTAPDIDFTSGGSGDIDPPSVAVTGGPKDMLSIAWMACDTAETITEPSGYSTIETQGTGGGGTSCTGGAAYRQFTGSSEDPGVFGGTSIEQFMAVTFLIHPAAGGGLDTINTDLRILWNMLNPVVTDCGILWNIQNAENTDIQLLWNINQAESRDLLLRWDILNEENVDLALAWNILSAEATDLTLTWNIFNSVSTDLSIVWNIESEALFRDLSLVWNIQNSVSSDLSILWNTLNKDSRDLGLLWNLLNSESTDLQLNWTILEQINSDLILRWNIDSDNIFPSISGRVTINTMTGAVVISTATSKYTIESATELT